MVKKNKVKASAVNLKTLFSGLQEQLVATLSMQRKNILHPGTKGDSSELCWLEMLQKYLPERYSASKGFVVDSNGGISEQIDIVVFDRHYSPFLFNQNGTTYIPAESVYVVIEVKQELTANFVDYAGKKAASVRKLKRTSTPIIHAGGKYLPKKPFPIQAGILTLDSSWSPSFGKPFREALKKSKGPNVLDFGCVLKQGSFRRSGKKIDVTTGEYALISLFLNLLGHLQAVGTVPALDAQAYLASIE